MNIPLLWESFFIEKRVVSSEDSPYVHISGCAVKTVQTVLKKLISGEIKLIEQDPVLTEQDIGILQTYAYFFYWKFSKWRSNFIPDPLIPMLESFNYDSTSILKATDNNNSNFLGTKILVIAMQNVAKTRLYSILKKVKSITEIHYDSSFSWNKFQEQKERIWIYDILNDFSSPSSLDEFHGFPCVSYLNWRNPFFVGCTISPFIVLELEPWWGILFQSF